MLIYADSQTVSHCRGCGSVILWVLTCKRHRRCPMQPDYSVRARHLDGSRRLVLDVETSAVHLSVCRHRRFSH